MAFKDWIARVCENDPLKRNPELIYPSVDESVWLIPSIGSFADSATFEDYLEGLKPVLLAQELQRILKNVSAFEGNFDGSQFDEFFSLEVRAHVAEVGVLKDWKSYLDNIRRDK